MFIRILLCSLILSCAISAEVVSQPPPPPPPTPSDPPVISLTAGSFSLFENTTITPRGRWGFKVGTGAVLLGDGMTHVKPQLYARYGVHSNLSLGVRIGGMINTNEVSLQPLGAVFEVKWGTLRLPHVADLAAGGGLGFINDGEKLSFMGEISIYESNNIASFLTSYSVSRISWLLDGRRRVQIGGGIDIKFSKPTHLLLGVSFSIGAGAFHPAAGLAVSSNF